MKYRLVVLVVLLCPVVAEANFGFWRRSPTVQSSSSYYYAAPVYVVPTYLAAPAVAPVFPVIPVAPPPLVTPSIPVVPATPGMIVPPMPPAAPYATPSVAPPSQTPDAPEATTPSGSTSFRMSERYYDLYPAALPSGQTVQAQHCSVAFWNLSGRALTVRIHGQTRTLTAGQSLTLELPRDFSWRVEGRGAELVQLGTKEAAAEILIRR